VHVAFNQQLNANGTAAVAFSLAFEVPGNTVATACIPASAAPGWNVLLDGAGAAASQNGTYACVLNVPTGKHTLSGPVG
jgi:hypothetical protein